MPRSLHGPMSWPLTGPRDKYALIAASLVGANISPWFDHFSLGNSTTPAGYTAFLAGTGAASMVPAGEASGVGWLSCSTGASASSQCAMVNQCAVAVVQSRPWYVATSFRLATTPDANSKVGVYLSDSATSRTIGVFASPGIVAGKFCLQHSGVLAGSGVDLGVNFDTNYHVVEWWGQGGANFLCRIDGGASLPGAITLAGAGVCQVAVIAQNGASAANQGIIADWVLAAGA